MSMNPVAPQLCARPFDFTFLSSRSSLRASLVVAGSSACSNCRSQTTGGRDSRRHLVAERTVLDVEGQLVEGDRDVVKSSRLAGRRN